MTSEDLKRVYEKQEELRQAIENNEILMKEKHDFARERREVNEWLKKELRELNELLKKEYGENKDPS